MMKKTNNWLKIRPNFLPLFSCTNDDKNRLRNTPVIHKTFGMQDGCLQKGYCCFLWIEGPSKELHDEKYNVQA